VLDIVTWWLRQLLLCVERACSTKRRYSALASERPSQL